MLWIGHGSSNLSGAWLATYETPEEIAHSGVHPRTLADLMVKQWQRRRPYEGAWSAMFIEACGAADFARKLAALLLEAPEAPARYAIVGVGGEYGATSLGQLHAVLRAAIDKTYTDNDGSQIPTRELISNLASRLDTGTAIHHGLHTASPVRRRVLLPVAVTAPIDVYCELRAFLADLPPDERHHFISKAQGAEQSELAWYFVGRHAEHRRLAEWLRTEHAGLLIVTGDAGSGKSALLGNLLLRTNPALYEVLAAAGQLEPTTADESSPPAAFDAVVQLTGFTVRTLVARLAAATGVLLPAGGTTGSDADRLVTALAARDRPTTILVDALDEAQEPLAIAGLLLRRIADVPHGRVVVGTRRSTLEGPDQPAPRHEDLLDVLGRGPRTYTLVVDRDPVALAAYVRKRLGAAVRSGRLAAGDGTISDITSMIGREDRHFLFARLAVHEILARPQLLGPDRLEELRELLGDDHRALFAAAVDRLACRSPAFRPLLRALALAHGRGVPRQDRTWIVIASALAVPPATITESDVDELCELAAPYIMLDAEDGQSVYRLAHRTFQEHFLDPAGHRRE